MNNKFQFIFTIALILILFIVSCAPQPAPLPTTPVDEPEDKVTVQIDTTGEAPIDEVGEDILDSLDIEEELDSFDLDEIDDILSDIENI